MEIPVTPLEPGQMYHIWTHANGIENLFRIDDNYHYFLKKYAIYIKPIADTFAYCLLPNHLHLMVRIKSEEDLTEYFNKIKLKSTSDRDLSGFQNLTGLVSKQFSHLFNSYAKAFNKKFNRRGSLFERPFKRKHINSDSYFITLIAYIHNNPMHHGFTDRPENWPFSSWNAYVLDKPTQINKQEALEWMGGRENFIKVHQSIQMEKEFFVLEDS